MGKTLNLKLVSVILLAAAIIAPLLSVFVQAQEQQARFWTVQAVDTAKYSRDLSRAKLNDPSFDAVIDDQVRRIADIGASHVVIATPYDEEFRPMLTRWVSVARKHNLSIWFRGNWAGWEGWFGYPRITRSQHLIKTEEFILENSFLFENGDIFTSCPECENGGTGDPRDSGDVAGHRQFLRDEYWITSNAFKNIGKNVRSNFSSMNGDVARLVMDQETTKALGGVVTIDHYVKDPKKLASDISDIANRSGGLVVLGEFGAPIPDIHGSFTESAQASWLEQALNELVKVESLIGLNYWVNQGGSTGLWQDSGQPKQAVDVLKKFYTPHVVSGTVRDEHAKPIPEANVTTPYGTVKPDPQGQFEVPFVGEEDDLKLKISATGFGDQEIIIDEPDEPVVIALAREDEGFWTRIWNTLKSLWRRIFG